MVSHIDKAMLLMEAASNPEVVATALAQKGVSPPSANLPAAPGAAPEPTLGELLEPQGQSGLSGLKAPASPPPLPMPGTPGAPQPSGQIVPPITLMELLMKQQQAQAPQIPDLGTLLGR